MLLSAASQETPGLNVTFPPRLHSKTNTVLLHLSQQQPAGKHNHSANEQCYFTTHSVSQPFKRFPLLYWNPAKL